jgi:hypothetical protein
MNDSTRGTQFIIRPLLLASMLWLAPLVGPANTAAAQAASNCTTTGNQTQCVYNTGGEQQLTVPSGVSSLHVVAVGAAGGNTLGGRGGNGAQVTADIPASGGVTLFVEVGLGGGAGEGGGGLGVSGGGESDVRTCSVAASCGALGTAQDPRLVVAGGGGGAGAAGGGGSGGAGGSGANSTCNPGANGTNASTGTTNNNGGGGSAGSCTQGGAGGTGGAGAIPGSPGSPGAAEVGGAGGTSCHGGGGGGGGYFGGGGGGGDSNSQAGNGGGGGGGSSFAETAATNVFMVPATTGSPSVTISFASGPASTTTAITASANPSTFGQAVTFTATVTPSTATGPVTFRDGTTSLGTGTLSSGTANLSTAALSVGTHSITAVYGGDANDTGSSSAPLSQTVQRATGTAITSSRNASTLGQSVTFTATVTPSSATGTVAFKDGAVTLGTSTLSAGKARLSTAGLSVGSHNITAVYGGDTNDSASTSPPLNQIVDQASSRTTLASSRNPSIIGESVTFTATVTPSFATGTVTFFDGAASLGTSALNTGKAVLITPSLSAGSHSITAVYGGDSNDSGSTSATLVQTVRQASSTVLGSSQNPSALGQSVTFTATVTPSSATGTVTFKEGATTLGTGTLSSGTATFSTAGLIHGRHRITAVYGGDSAVAPSTSTSITQTVN